MPRPFLCPAGHREAIPTCRDGWEQLTGVATTLAGQGEMPWGCPTAGSPGTAHCSRAPHGPAQLQLQHCPCIHQLPTLWQRRALTSSPQNAAEATPTAHRHLHHG